MQAHPALSDRRTRTRSGKHDRIRRITPDGRISTVKGSIGIRAPEYMVVTRNGALDVASQDADRIYQIAPDGHRTMMLARARAAFRETEARSAKAVRAIRPRARQRREPLRLGDHRQPSTQNRSTGIIHTVAGTGRPGSRGDAGPATRAQLKTPFGMATDVHGNLYIADGGNGRVREVDQHGIIETIAGGH